MSTTRPHPPGDESAPAVRARQGVTGHNVSYVLFAGTVGVILLMTAVYIGYFA